MQEQTLLQLNGSVEHIIYRNAESGYTVLELNTGETLTVAVGIFAGVEEGEELTLSGRYINHPSYGEQFKVELYERRLPESTTAICKYLSSGAVRGIGPATAKRIVEMFGADTLNILENDPIRLASIKGISQKKALDIGEAFRELFGVRTVMLFLANYGITPAQGVRIWKQWGNLAVDIIKANPYALCNDALGIRFAQADEIARQLELPPENPNRISAALAYVLQKNLMNGHTCLPADKLIGAACRVLELPTEQVSEALTEAVARQELYGVERGKLYIYLPAMLTAESYITSRITLLTAEPPQDEADCDRLIAAFEQTHGIRYAELQKTAIRQALSSRILILTGGPGTGKTTALNAILALLEQQGKTVLIAAPTGRAAKRISEVTGREAKTVHRLLEVKFDEGEKTSFVHNADKPLDCDVLIVDEMSMMDTLLFDALLRALPTAAKLIMVGDSDQLPSVGAGNVLKDLIEADVVPTVRLTEIFRQAAKSLIVTGAHQIVNGEMPDLTRTDNDFFFIRRRSLSDARQTVVDLAAVRLPKTYGFDPIEDIQVLCPGRKGETGATELNRCLQLQLNPPSDKKPELNRGGAVFREGDKVMQIKNNYDIPWAKGAQSGLGIFNGDIGRIRSIDRANGVMQVAFDERLATYTFEMTAELELAYATTVHKSQGSEFNAVILPVIGGYDKLYFRNLLYTAVTRAKKILVLVGSENRLRYMVDNNLKTLRYTGLKYFLQNGIVF